MHLERLTNLLEIVAVAGRPVSVGDAQAASGLPKPTCYRLFNALQEQGLIEEPNGDGHYIIGERLIRIALLGKSDVDVRRVSAPLLKAEATKLNETVFLSRFRDRKVEIIHVETPQDPTRAFVHPGMGERPLHACSCSKAIAAFAEESFVQRILDGTLKAYTEHTKTTRDELLDDFERIRRQGFADCDQEIDIGIASVAAPVMISNIGATFSVGAVGPVRRFGSEYRKGIGEQLTKLATKVSAAIQLCNVAEV
ncbi:IclR family transcriptional regulator [uncultured Roseobacter sp.]|uniref:IclR family transcriptional regulator n=1 Tax=uncultured Roseobacter sp. TaxID=114847 RepID=UPI00260FA2D1|nr:IclR family transcriptional regulator [uncultured Roseobacter sp.]